MATNIETQEEIILTGEGSNVVVEPGRYQMSLEKIEILPSNFGGQSLKWHWKTFHAEHGEIRLNMMTNARVTPATRAGKALTVLNGGQSVGLGEQVRVHDYVGCVCEVHVENRVSSKDGLTYSNVTEVIKLVDDSGSFASSRQPGEEAKAATAEEPQNNSGAPASF